MTPCVSCKCATGLRQRPSQDEDYHRHAASHLATSPGARQAGAALVAKSRRDVVGRMRAVRKPPLPGLARRLRSAWTTDPAGVLGAAVSFAVVAGTVGFVFAQLQPGLLFGPGMDVGGDTAGHVVAVHYLIHDLLPHGRLTGWDPQWFDGFPLYVFYFPLPALGIAALSLVLPYAVAFKVVTALGPLLIPVAAFAFGRLAGYRRPVPALMSVGTLGLLFLYASGANTSVYASWNIDGGTIASTMAGEFSFTLGVAFALLFLGVFAYGLRTGRLRWLAALLFLATVLCHVVPALFAAGAAVVLTLACGTRRSLLTTLVPVGLAGGLLAAFWLLPFGAYLRYASSMGYGRVGSAYQNLVPQDGEQAVQWLAVLGLGLALAHRDRLALALAAIAAASALGFLVLPSGLVYNGRWLPFWFLTTSLLAGYAVAEAGRMAFSGGVLARWHPSATGLVGGAAALALVAGWLGILPFYTPPAGSVNPVDGWVSWNYSGYQAKPGWAQFESLVAMLEHAAALHGCGRLDYEYSPNMTDTFGSTLAPMSFPLWTHGCIDTTEGLYYESSTTTPFHFLDQSELSIDPSNPVVGIPYQGLDVADGIRHLQLAGVRYFLANSPSVEKAAGADRSLVEVGTVPASAGVVDGLAAGQPAPPGAAWDLYLVRDSALVTPLAYDPVVEQGLSKERFLDLGISWYQGEQYWPVPIARAGPASWPRRGPGVLVAPGAATPAPSTTVSAIETTGSSMSFDVSRTGTPVLVKVPYFPNWQATGASGPYEVSPNLMVVVPSARHVSLHYGTTGIDVAGKLTSLLGVGVTALLVRPVTGGLRPGIAGGGAVQDGAASPPSTAEPAAPPSTAEPAAPPEPEPEPDPDPDPDLDLGPAREPGDRYDEESQ